MTPEALQEFATKVNHQIANSRAIPERANLLYFIVSMVWFKRWEAYSSAQSTVHPGQINSFEDIKGLLFTK
jgi:hypothetical protein